MLFLLCMVCLSHPLLHCGGLSCPSLQPEPPGPGRSHTAVQGDLSSSSICRVNGPAAPEGQAVRPWLPLFCPTFWQRPTQRSCSNDRATARPARGNIPWEALCVGTARQRLTVPITGFEKRLGILPVRTMAGVQALNFPVSSTTAHND